MCIQWLNDDWGHRVGDLNKTSSIFNWIHRLITYKIHHQKHKQWNHSAVSMDYRCFSLNMSSFMCNFWKSFDFFGLPKFLIFSKYSVFINRPACAIFWENLYCCTEIVICLTQAIYNCNKWYRNKLERNLNISKGKSWKVKEYIIR